MEPTILFSKNYFINSAIKKRVEALDREEKELDQRLKELQLKGLKAVETVV